jgi:hypothetical protein
MDLTTTYLGLSLKNPLVARHRRSPRTSTISAGWRMPALLLWFCLRSSRSKSGARRMRRNRSSGKDSLKTYVAGTG